MINVTLPLTLLGYMVVTFATIPVSGQLREVSVQSVFGFLVLNHGVWVQSS